MDFALLIFLLAVNFYCDHMNKIISFQLMLRSFAATEQLVIKSNLNLRLNSLKLHQYMNINIERYHFAEFPEDCDSFNGPHSVRCLLSLWVDNGCAEKGLFHYINDTGPGKFLNQLRLRYCNVQCCIILVIV